MSEKTNAMQKKPPYGMIAILFIGAFVAILNETLLNVALPSIMEEFDVNATTVQWLSTGYMLINGILIPASAFFIQRFTDKKIIYYSNVIVYIGNTPGQYCTCLWCVIRGTNDSSFRLRDYDAIINECHAYRFSSRKKEGQQWVCLVL